MERFTTTWKTFVAATFAASAVMLTGCDSQSNGTRPSSPEIENSTSEPADVDIDVPGADIEIRKDQDSVDIDVDSPE